MTKEFYKKERPKSFKQMVGSEAAVAQCKEWVREDRVPHFVIFQGGSGMGKTTLARIMAKKLDCGPADLQEINAAGQARGIEKVKQIESQIGMSPIQGESRVYLVDEAQQLTTAAQNAILKMTEDTPSHVYFFFCTTDPHKLVPTIRTRASVVTVSPLSSVDMLVLLERTRDKYKVEASYKVLEAIVEAAEGSARKGMVLLYQVVGLSEKQQLECVTKSDMKTKGIDLCRKLMNPRTKWKDITSILKDLEDEAETVRWIMLGYASSIMLSGRRSSNRAFVILDQFSENYFDTKKGGLIRDCWTVIHGRQDE